MTAINLDFENGTYLCSSVASVASVAKLYFLIKPPKAARWNPWQYGIASAEGGNARIHDKISVASLTKKIIHTCAKLS